MRHCFDHSATQVDSPKRHHLLQSTPTKISIILFSAVALITACGSDAGDDFADMPTGVEGDSSSISSTVDSSLTRDDVDCSAAGLGKDKTSTFITAHYVVGGVLGATCFGDADPALIQAWEILSIITPSPQLADLGLFGSFKSTEGGDEVTLAFVNALDDVGTFFQMSINLDPFKEDPNEAFLTLAHEFSHVLTALPSQINRSVESEDKCATYDNGEGCYLPNSFMALWVTLFWGDGLVDEIDPSEGANGNAGLDRCSINPGFLGPYAASSPEEDFAESFSAFVFQLDAGSDAVQAKLDWMSEQPGLVEFRNRAVIAGIGPLENNFEPCGEG